jgi:hypothetical protein
MRIVSFGCSFTFGHGLKDCFIPPGGPGNKPSIHSWPAIIAKELSVECVNKSSCGSSNKRIWHNIIKFNFKENDIVFIMWTHPERYAVLNSKKILDVGPWFDDFKNYYKYYYSKYDAGIMSKLFVSHANSFLENKNITVFNLVIDEKNKFIFEFDKKINHLPIYIAAYKLQFPLALDNKHPGEHCHKETARMIMQELKLQHSISRQKKLSLIEQMRLWLTQ